MTKFKPKFPEIEIIDKTLSGQENQNLQQSQPISSSSKHEEIITEKMLEEQKEKEYFDKVTAPHFSKSKFPSKERIQQMEDIFKMWWSVDDVCKILWISFKTYKNRTNTHREYNSYFTRGYQQKMLMRLKSAKVTYKLQCLYNLSKLARTNVNAAIKMLNRAWDIEKEEQTRFENKHDFLDELYPEEKYDYSLEDDTYYE